MSGRYLTILWLTFAVLSVAVISAAGSDKTNSPKAEFAKIFNGKDLTGWQGDPAYWSVKNGILVARTEPGTTLKNHSYLIWQGGNVKDFELRLKIRSTEGNSGIDYRAERVLIGRDGAPLKWTIRGYQADIAKGWMGSLYNWGKIGAQPSQFVAAAGDESVDKYLGSVADKQALLDMEYYRPGQWNEFTVIARGSHVVQRINGYPVVEFIDNTSQTRREGLLGLQVHAGNRPFLNEFKDIRIRPFEMNFGRARLLFNAKDLTGWTLPDQNAKNAWTVEDGALVTKNADNTYISTKDDYTNYVLRFQYRRDGKTKGALLLCISGPDRSDRNLVRIHGDGDGDDFNQITPEGFDLKQRAKDKTPKTAFKKAPPNLWNECEVVLNEGRLEVRVNQVVGAKAKLDTQAGGKIGFEASASAKYRNIVLIPILPGLSASVPGR